MTDWFDGTLVKLLSGADFEDREPWKMKNKRCWFVLFFADWCGHCRNLKPEYIKFADMAQFIKVAAVDSDANKTLMDKLGDPPLEIRGFPTVWIYKDGSPLKEYDGPRTAQGLLQEAMNVCNTECECEK